MKFTISWSGGKDSALAYLLAFKEGFEPASLIHISNESGEHARAHDLPLFILEEQSNAIGIPLICEPASWKLYGEVFLKNIESTKQLHQAELIVFGDIDLQYHLNWENELSKKATIKPIWPLKNKSRIEVARQIIDSGIKAVIISVQDHLSSAWLGKEFSHEILDQLIQNQIDPCGEDGSFHTLVYDAPFFKQKINFSLGKIKEENAHFFIEIINNA